MTGDFASYESSGDVATRQVLNFVRSGEAIEAQLVALASIGGTRLEPTPEQPERYATNRVALSVEDKRAREEFIRPLMLEAGMEVREHPFGLIGITYGEDSSLAPLVRLSHTDTVPNGDMYDGDVGVIGEIEVGRAMREAGIKPRRTTIDLVLSGEESAAFGFVTFGSHAMFHGLNEKELDSANAQGVRIRDMLTPEEIAIVQQPIFGPNTMFGTPHAVVELHVEQGSTLEAQDIDLGVVEGIAAPIRHIVQIGDTVLHAQAPDHELTQYLQLTVHGQAGHSGTTPMGTDLRADGLVATADYLLPFMRPQLGSERPVISVGPIEIEGGAINKIPGVTATLLRLNGDSLAEIEAVADKLQAKVDRQNEIYGGSDTRFDAQALGLEVITRPNTVFFEQAGMGRRQTAALAIVSAVNEIATKYGSKQVVGTVGTYHTTPEGIIKLGLDVRGSNKQSRNEAQAYIGSQIAKFGVLAPTSLGERLSGSGDPVELDNNLVTAADAAIKDFNIGSSKIMISAAGHDAQNAARAGIPAVMLFSQSGHEGKAHHPDAYTPPENLYKAVRALAALSMRLAA